jgi:hypothetical protein
LEKTEELIEAMAKLVTDSMKQVMLAKLYWMTERKKLWQ